MHDYPPEFDEERLDNTFFAEAFPDATGPGDLDRGIYRGTACGAHLSVLIDQWVTVEGETPDDYPTETRVSRWVHSGELDSLGTWEDLDQRGMLITAMMVGSIVEGIDQTTESFEIHARQLDEEPEEFAKRLHAKLEEVESEAASLWNSTHGCEECAAHWRGEGIETIEGEHFEGCDGATPVWTDCPECSGDGVAI